MFHMAIRIPALRSNAGKDGKIQLRRSKILSCKLMNAFKKCNKLPQKPLYLISNF